MLHRPLLASFVLPFVVAVSVGACAASRTGQPSVTDAAPPEAEHPLRAETPRDGASTPPLSQRIAEDLTVRRLRDGVYVVTHSFPWAANCLVVDVDGDDVLLVDTPYTPEATEQLLQWVEAELGSQRVTAIVTGFHHDNLGGTEALVRRGIPVHGSNETARLLAERGDALRSMTLEWLSSPELKRFRDVHEALPYVPPTQRFSLQEGLTLVFGKEQVQVHYPGPSHSPDNVVVYFPDRRVLFGGCAVIGMDRVGNTSDADLEAWPTAVESLRQFDAELVIPGHGDRTDPGLIDYTVRLLRGN